MMAVARFIFLSAAIFLGVATSAAAQPTEPYCGMRKYFVPAGHKGLGADWDSHVPRWPFEDHPNYVVAASGLSGDSQAIERFQDQIARIVGRRMSIVHDQSRHSRPRAVWVASRKTTAEAARSFEATMVFGSVPMAELALGTREPPDDCVVFSQVDLRDMRKYVVSFGYVPAPLAGSGRNACIASVFLRALGIHVPARFAAEVLVAEAGQLALNERGEFLVRALYSASADELRKTSLFLTGRDGEFQRRFCAR
jgi:hypothetical protein